jgi:protein-arginine deiminase
MSVAITDRLAGLLLAGSLVACSSDDADSGRGRGAGPVDLRADNDRNGLVELDAPSEDEGEDAWDASHGAIFLANIDDDLEACPDSTSDVELPKCNDAADDVVNGAEDLADLAPLKIRPWPDAPDGARGVVELTEPGASAVRLFRASGGAPALFAPRELSTSDLRSGVELWLEGKDILRDRAQWDGFVDVTLIVGMPGGDELGRDRVRLRLSPVITHHHLMPAETVHVARLAGSEPSQRFGADVAAAAREAGVPNPIHEIAIDDPWIQDFFEPAFMAMPAAAGAQHVIRVYYRSANTRSPAPLLRRAGQVVFTAFRGPDRAGIQQYDPTRAPMDDTFDSFGNTETIPPYTQDGVAYPLGRLFRGSVELADQSFARMLEAQSLQPPVYIYTDWLSVGHVDETISFVKAATPRGWIVLVNDARLARQMLEEQVEQGNGSVPMFVGLFWDGEDATTTIADVLADTEIMSASAESAAEVDGQLEVLKKELGLDESEIVRVPFLHSRVYDGSIAYQPATVNGAYLSDGHFAVPDPHGPVIGGKDMFKTQLETALAPHGIQVHFIEDWDLYHVRGGEVHCGTNITRRVPTDIAWWETSR